MRLILGFLFILFGIILLIFFNSRHEEFTREIEALRHDLRIKLIAVERMKSATLGRNNSLVLLPLLDTLSDRRREQKSFYGHTKDFLLARRKLSKIDLTPLEDKALGEVKEKIVELEGPILTAMQLLVSEGKTPQSVAAAEAAKAIQADIVERLNSFVDKVQEIAQLREARLESDLRASRNAISFLSFFILALSFLIAVVVIWIERVNRLRIIEATMTAEAAKTEMQHLANHDALTGLPSLRLCKDRLDCAMTGDRRNKSQTAVLFIDLDGFKAVNDTMGHEAGDEVLKSVAKRLKSTIRESDTVARIGGDEFILMMLNIDHKDAAAKVARKIITKLSEPFSVIGGVAQIGASIGIAISPIDGDTSDVLLRHADQSMYVIKKQGKNNFGFFGQADDSAPIQKH